ncbi:RluA family pseudouridine synthase [Enterococcus timonensis]|uniref:RluA family pseudouridine synthase n=1 Tax=Enterococcus timonensis TaxID=1852364 RepID=UPI0008D9F72C|nr:RluA family pseudouridine synthase [Enterococcus timonensis]
MKTYILEEDGRLDSILAQTMAVSRSQVQQWLKEELVTINNQVVRANYKAKKGEVVAVEEKIPEVLDLLPENIPLEIIYEDDDLAVVNKPQGMVVHPSAGHPTGTLVNALLFHMKNLSTINDVIRPGIVHRIDKDTSGLLMIAKNDFAHENLAAQLKNKTSQRKYLAIVHGTFSHDNGTIDAPVGRSKQDRKKQAVIADGKEAVTHFKVLETFDDYSLLQLQLETGRTHQIRVHMQYIKHPVAGDLLYGPRKTLAGNGQFLHAQLLGFTHPTTGEKMVFEVDPPEIFQKTLEQLRNEKA